MSSRSEWLNVTAASPRPGPRPDRLDATMDAIYVVGEDGRVVSSIPRIPYQLEGHLQDLVAKNPDLLPGDQIDPERPRRWRLIKREARVGEALGESRWSLDHLFVDQDAIPTLVEAKRAGNPEIRREVVGQLLEYAANGTLHWDVGRLRSWFEDSFASSEDAVASIRELLKLESLDAAAETYNDFWERLGANLQDRRIRLIFVADRIPPALRTLVEFINEQMERVEVLAVEIVQYSDGRQRMLMPRLIGQTAKARERKNQPSGWTQRADRWREEEFLLEVQHRYPELVEVVRRILAWANEQPRILLEGGQGLKGPAIMLRLEGITRIARLVAEKTARLELQFATLKNVAPFTDLGVRRRFYERFAAVGRFDYPDEKTEGYPAVPLSSVVSPQAMSALLAILDDMVTELQRAHAVSNGDRQQGK
jgi:hypothetical protein